MIDYYILHGTCLVGSGTVQEEVLDRVFVPDNCRLVRGRAPVPRGPRPAVDAVWDTASASWRLTECSESVAWGRVRLQRDRLLTESDWVTLRAQEQGAPVPPEWLAYRQALRDITDQPDPQAIVWPEPPA